MIGFLPVALTAGLISLFVGIPEYHSPFYIEGEQPTQHSGKRIAKDLATTVIVPIEFSPSSVQLGSSKYNLNCVSCHGKDGIADAAFASTLSVPLEDLNSWAVQWRQDEDIFRIISDHEGVKPSFKDQFTAEERWGLVHFLKKTFSPDGSPPWYSLKGQSSGKIGKAVYETLNCRRCHETDLPGEIAGFPPKLNYAGSKLNRDWIVEYILNPHQIRWKSQGIRPLVRMPSFRLEQWEAEALGDFLATKVDTIQFPEKGWMNQGSVGEGKNLFKSYQCLGCHTMAGEGNQIGPDLTRIAARMRPAYMFQFMKNPLGIIPGTAMKDYELWDSEASSLVLYLQTLK